MMRLSTKTNAIPAAMLLAAAMLPMSPLMTLGAYGDSETSQQNVMQASKDFTPRNQFKLLLDEPGPDTVSFAAFIEEGEVAGTSTEQEVPEEPAPVVEISEPVVEITTPEVVEDPEEPVGPTPEPAVEEELTPAPEPESEPEPTPESDPQPETTPSEEPAS